jgi:hypothetical protein
LSEEDWTSLTISLLEDFIRKMLNAINLNWCWKRAECWVDSGVPVVLGSWRGTAAEAGGKEKEMQDVHLDRSAF